LIVSEKRCVFLKVFAKEMYVLESVCKLEKDVFSCECLQERSVFLKVFAKEMYFLENVCKRDLFGVTRVDKSSDSIYKFLASVCKREVFS